MATYAATRFAKAVFYLALFAPIECRRTVEACRLYVLVYRLGKQAGVRKEPRQSQETRQKDRDREEREKSALPTRAPTNLSNF